VPPNCENCLLLVLADLSASLGAQSNSGLTHRKYNNHHPIENDSESAERAVEFARGTNGIQLPWRPPRLHKPLRRGERYFIWYGNWSSPERQGRAIDRDRLHKEFGGSPTSTATPSVLRLAS